MDAARNFAGAEKNTVTKDGGAKYSMRDIEIKRVFIDYGDAVAEQVAINRAVESLVDRRKVVKINTDNIKNHGISNKSDNRKFARQYLKGILAKFMGNSVYFTHNNQHIEAYLTRAGVDHSVGGIITAERAEIFDQFKDLVKKAEYAFSSENDVHSNTNKKIGGKIDWDCFVAVAMVGKDKYPVVFKIRTIDRDLRSQIHEIAIKKEINGSHDLGQQAKTLGEMSAYGVVPSTSGQKISQNDNGVNKKFSGRDRDYMDAARNFAGAEKNTAKSGVRYALGDGTVKDVSKLSKSDLQYLLESAQNGVLSDNSFIPLRRDTPEFFIEVVKEHSKGLVVVENHPMAATVEHLRQNMDEEDGQSYGSARPHGFSTGDSITMTEKMGDPSYIVLQKNGRYAEVVSFYNKRNKQVVVAIDFADSSSIKPKNYKYSQYMNGNDGGYYNIIVTQYEPDNLAKYLKDCEIVYSKKEMNGRYQVGSGRVVTVTHDTPFIENIVAEQKSGVNKKFSGRDRDYMDAAQNFAGVEKNTTAEGGMKVQIREIVGVSGRHYGKGVYLDSNMLANLSEEQRKNTVKGHLRKLGGKAFVAYDKDGIAREIMIASSSQRFRNTKGKSVPVNNHMTSFLNNPLKQEALVLVDEVIEISSFEGKENAIHPHDWLDNNGKNLWDVWKVFLQEKNKTVWEATLRVANTSNGEKILYELHPIQMVEAARKPGTSTTKDSVSQPEDGVNKKFSGRDRDYMDAAQNFAGAENNTRDIENGGEIPYSKRS